MYCNFLIVDKQLLKNATIGQVSTFIYNLIVKSVWNLCTFILYFGSQEHYQPAPRYIWLQQVLYTKHYVKHQTWNS